MQMYYIIRSKVDGKYLAARPDPDSTSSYLLLFPENFDALSYLNKYAGELKDKLGVEAIDRTQIKAVLQRWGFIGIGMVNDPLVPSIEFLIQK
ncbi:MAG: hypothetical protein WBB29_05755 [Geitlerinemataceae cyanobacterium]